MKRRGKTSYKPVDLAYCYQCKHVIGGYRMVYDFCKYDGSKIIQADGVKFRFRCKHYCPRKPFGYCESRGYYF